MKRAALIVTDRERFAHDAEGPEDGVRPLRTIDTDPQLLAALRTLAALPDLLQLADNPPTILETPVTVSNADLLAAMDAADRVRALLPKEES